MAETYHCFNWRELPLRLAATLAIGLDADSRTKRKLAGDAPRLETMLLAAILDQLQILRWYKTEDGRKGKNPPEMMAGKLIKQSKKPEKQRPFDSAAFEEKWRRITGGT